MEKVYVVLDGPPGPTRTSGGFVEMEDDNGKGVHVPGFAMHREGFPDGTWNIGPLYKLDDGEFVLERSEIIELHDLVVAKVEKMDDWEMGQGLPHDHNHPLRVLRRKLRAEVLS